MDIEKLIEDLQEISQKNSISHYKRDKCAAAATALSMLRSELTHKTELVRQQSNELERRDNLLKEQEAELEASLALLKEQESELKQVKRERDEAREVICAYCLDIPCKGENCCWYCGPKEG